MKDQLCRVGRLCLLLALVVSTSWRGAGAEGGVVQFDLANQRYEQGKYAEAIAAYQSLLTNQSPSAAVYFNLGNAHFKLGQHGQAIAAYRLAQRLDPRDPDIRANLRFARESVGGTVRSKGLWERGLDRFTPNELTLTAMILGWLWLLVLGYGQWRRQRPRGLRPYRVLLSGLTVIVAGWLGVVAQGRLGKSEGVVVEKEAAIRIGPFEEAQSSFTLRDGAELTVVNRKGDWLYIVDGAKRMGWVPETDVLLLPRG